MAIELEIPVGERQEVLAGGEKLALYRFTNVGTGTMKIDSKTLEPGRTIDLWLKSATVQAGTVTNKRYAISYDFLTV